MAKRIVRLVETTKLTMDVAHPLEGTPMLQPHDGITRGLPGQCLIVRQSLFEEFLLEGIESVLEPVLGNLRVHVVNRPAGLLPLQLGLIPLAGNQYRADTQGDRRGDQQAGGGCHGGPMPSSPAEGPPRPGIGTGVNRLVGQITLKVLGQLGCRGIALLSWFRECLQTDRLQGRIECGVELAWRPRWLLPHPMEDLHRFLAGIRRLSGQDLVENGAETIDIGPLIDLVK